jgi:hypothetical protein
MSLYTASLKWALPILGLNALAIHMGTIRSRMLNNAFNQPGDESNWVLKPIFKLMFFVFSTPKIDDKTRAKRVQVYTDLQRNFCEVMVPFTLLVGVICHMSYVVCQYVTCIYTYNNRHNYTQIYCIYTHISYDAYIYDEHGKVRTYAYVRCLYAYVMCLYAYVICIYAYVVCIYAYIICICAYIICICAYVVCINAYDICINAYDMCLNVYVFYV